jgi:hypothetical protein
MYSSTLCQANVTIFSAVSHRNHNKITVLLHNFITGFVYDSMSLISKRRLMKSSTGPIYSSKTCTSI